MKNKRLKTIAIIVSDVDKAIAFEWIADSLKSDFQLVFLLIGSERSALYRYLKSQSIQVYIFPSRNRISQINTLAAMFWRLLKLRPAIVHTHLVKANLAGLTAAWLLRVPKRIYTRHHALVHHNEYPQGLWQDKWCNYAATHIVAISKNTANILTNLEGVSPDKITIIHHGFDLQYFTDVHPLTIEQLRLKHKIALTKPIVGVVARYQPWKGIQYIIPAFSNLLKQFPRAHLILANAVGSYQVEIRKMLQTLPKGAYTEIPFEDNAPALFGLFDVYVHTPLNDQGEAFGQTYVEALACGVPSVFTLSGIAPEFIAHEENALVVPFCNSENIYQSVIRILNNHDLRSKLIANGKESVSKFSLDKMINSFKQLYGS